MNKDCVLLAIESSCDETSAAVLKNGEILSNLIANQQIHAQYGGVVPELASREHQKNIVPVVSEALKKAQVQLHDLNAVAFTQGPGLMGSLLVGTSFAKGLALALHLPLIEVNHLEAHVLAHFIPEYLPDGTLKPQPKLPFLCLTVSGGHTQIVLVKDYLSMEIIGETQDDAVGEAFDKTAKLLGLPYPGGPLIDKYAQHGNPHAFTFAKTTMPNLDFSFSGIKTAILYFLQSQTQKNPQFIQEHLADICASIQKTLVDMLMAKLIQAAEQSNIKQIAIAGGVAANSALRQALQKEGQAREWQVFIPKLEYCTDNAAMIAMAAYFKYQKGLFASQRTSPYARLQ
ncbi:MAG: tRNA (adenosine(37)-N6)-threonylcarbamoyltransferase complex transferase subunit TsaD [Microscillaceae bacterium]|nr:tRNA (adenosine(37)-N6)-threonylcarbamoyltransferase complex transferase subunit TsaD [Microscillaceae bacterium]MDW8461542.1 tRNA (adenosine(37)-N6)-threonylcarbamoyltransferase complex transferase subunit TsaD [Cytophagales bacterium]